MPIPSDMAGAFPASNFGSFGADLFIPWQVGAWYASPLCKANRTGGNTLNSLYLWPFNSGPDGCTIGSLDANVTAVGTAGAVVRAGLYQIINQARPFSFNLGTPYANLVLDAGTQPTDGSTGEKIWTLTPPIVFQPNIWFAIAGVDQVALATRSLGNNAAATWSPFGSASSNPYAQVPVLSLRQLNVTGVLPFAFTPDGNFTADGGIGFRRSA